MKITRELLESVIAEEHLGESVEVKGHSRYEAAHGKKPRGEGSWLFGLGPRSNHETPAGSTKWDQVVTKRGSFSKAQTAAKQHARELGHKEIHILT